VLHLFRFTSALAPVVLGLILFGMVSAGAVPSNIANGTFLRGSSLFPRALLPQYQNITNPTPVNIYRIYSSPPVPTGLADYGILNSSGSVTAYMQAASEVSGYAVISSIAAHNATVPSTSSSPFGAGLQLNVMLRANTTTGQYVYWLQNVLVFYTNNNTAYFEDNIWNQSASNSVLDQSEISGSGEVLPYESTSYYAAASDYIHDATPLTTKMLIVVSHSGNSVNLNFGYQYSSGDRPLSGRIKHYDNVTIDEGHSVQDAAIIISGYEMTPSRHYFDAELVFTGDCCGAVTTFTSMNSTLSISYTLTNGTVSAPRSVYEFGSDTAEGAYNLRTSVVQDKLHVGLGKVGFSKSFVLSKVILPTRLTLSFASSDGMAIDPAPVLNYFSNGMPVTANLSTTQQTYDVDAGTTWKVTPTIGGDWSGERWSALGITNGTAATDQTLVITYYHQFLYDLYYTVIDGGNPMAPNLVSTRFGAPYTSTLTIGVTEYWLDSGAQWGVPSLLGGSTAQERWITTQPTGGAVSQSAVIQFNYYHQYYLTVGFSPVAGGSVNVMNGWNEAGSTLQIVASANPGWELKGWVGTGSGSSSATENSSFITFSSAITENAVFYPGLTITAGTGGSVSYAAGTALPMGIVQGGESSTIYVLLGTNVTMTEGLSTFLYEFTGWTEGASGMNSTISVTLNAPTAIEADFSFDYVNIGGIVVAIVAVIAVAILILRRRGAAQTQTYGI